jgi:3-dehydroquinate dehydratase-2
MKHSVYVLSGPNLNLLGKREPHLYGHTTLAQVEARCKIVSDQLDFSMFFAQSNDEARLIDWIHESREKPAGLVINPAGLSFFSVPLLDAVKTVSEPVIEVHITNIHRREPLYQKSIISYGATGVICGLGPFGYEAALLAIADQYRQKEEGSKQL